MSNTKKKSAEAQKKEEQKKQRMLAASMDSLLHNMTPRIRPVLQKEPFSYDVGSAEYLFEQMGRETFKIDDKFRVGSGPYEDRMEVISVLTKVEDKTKAPPGIKVIGCTESMKIRHYDVSVRFVPAETGRFLMSEKIDSYEGGGKWAVYEHSVEIQRDIVKYGSTLLLPYLYALYRAEWFDDDERECLDQTLANAAGVVIDSVSVLSCGGDFLEWFKDVGESLAEAYRKNPDTGLRNILGDIVYVVYGDFDPNTREMGGAPAKPKEDGVCEDDDE